MAAKLYQSEENLLLVGSILPDLAVTKIIKWEGGLHEKEAIDSFLQFIQKEDSSYLNLYKGIVAHNILDDFTHKNYLGGSGYAYQNNKELTRLVIKYYDLDKDAASGKSHNYIESAVDILLLKEYPDIQNKLKRAIKQTDKKRLLNLLSGYFKVDEAKFSAALSQFFDLFTKYDLTKEVSWVIFWGDLEKLLSLKNIGDQKRQELLNQAIEIVKNTHKDFLNYSLLKGLKKIEY